MVHYTYLVYLATVKIIFVSSQKGKTNELCVLQVGGVYVRLFLKDPKFPLRNPKRFLEGLLDQYVSAVAATHLKGAGGLIDSDLALLLSAALVSLLRVHPSLADHVAHLGYIPKLVGSMANESKRETMSSVETTKGDEESSEEDVVKEKPIGWMMGNQTSQERVRLSCLRVLHQLAASTACAEAMATTGIGSPQVWFSCLLIQSSPSVLVIMICTASSWPRIFKIFLV